MASKTTAKTAPPARRQALVVAGMHRSGTSAMARLLSLSGAILPERVMDPGPDNPLGYWEPWEMVALSDALMAAVDSRWDNVFAVADNERAWMARAGFLDEAKAFLAHNFGDQDLLVMKDPRASVLTRFWREALVQQGIDPVYVVMVRHPLEVAESLMARNGFTREKSLLLWTSYMLAIERDTRDAPRIFVAYSDMLNDWRGTLDRVEQVLGRPLPRRTPAATVDIERFLSKSHRHHEADLAALESAPDVWSGAKTTYRWMLEAAHGTAGPTKPLAEVEAELAQLERTIGPVIAEMRRDLDQKAFEGELHTQAQLAETRQEVSDLRAHFDAFHAESDAALAALQVTVEQWRREAEADGAKVAILREKAGVLEHEAAALSAHLAATQEHVEGLKAEIRAIFASTSWRVTRPLRAIVRRLRPG